VCGIRHTVSRSPLAAVNGENSRAKVQNVREDSSANRHKPSGVEGKESILRVHLLPLLGAKKLDAINNEDVQRLKSKLLDKAPKTVNNVLSVLNTLLRVAVEWKVIERSGCAVRLVKAPKPKMGFLDFEEFERLVVAAKAIDRETHLIVLLAGEAGLRAGEIMGLRCGDIDLVRGYLTVAQSAWKKHMTATKGERCRHVRMTRRLTEAVRQHRHLRSEFVLANPDGSHLSYKQVWAMVLRAGNKAQVIGAAHRLGHTFCSHLMMRGAPALAIKELAGHTSLTTTQGYLHLSPAAADSAIRLLDERIVTVNFGEMLETGGDRKTK
jgi:integrase